VLSYRNDAATFALFNSASTLTYSTLLTSKSFRSKCERVGVLVRCSTEWECPHQKIVKLNVVSNRFGRQTEQRSPARCEAYVFFLPEHRVAQCTSDVPLTTAQTIVSVDINTHTHISGHQVKNK